MTRDQHASKIILVLFLVVLALFGIQTVLKTPTGYTVIQGNITEAGIGNIVIKVNGSDNLAQNFTGMQLVEFLDITEPVASFYWNFSDAVLDLSKISIESIPGELAVIGLGVEKTLFVARGENSQVCVRDYEGASIVDFTDNCDDAQEILVDCDGQLHEGYNCSIYAEWFSVSGLQHTAVKTVGALNVQNEVRDNNNKLYGTKVADEPGFETHFVSLEKTNTTIKVVFYHDASGPQAIVIEGDVDYTLSSELAEPLEFVELVVVLVDGIVPKFKLHVGSTSEVFEFGKQIPEVDFDGSYSLIDRDDSLLDVELVNDDAVVVIKGTNASEINAKAGLISDELLNTGVFASESLPMEEAQIVLPKTEDVTAILECPDFNVDTFVCEGEWQPTNIPFTDNGTHIIFTVDHFSGYGGGMITVINIQSFPSMGGNWTVEFSTFGVGNLTITGIHGTSFSTDLEFLELRCGNTTVPALYDGSKVFVADYSCNDTSFEASKILTSGKHSLMFEFGNSTAYAYNLVISGRNLVTNVLNSTLVAEDIQDALTPTDTLDFNGDSITDYVIGAYSRNDTVNNISYAGEVYVVLGPVYANTSRNLNTSNVSYIGVNNISMTGVAVAAGNFNGDALGDFAIGASGDRTSGLSQAGAVYLIHGNASVSGKKLLSIPASYAARIIGTTFDGRFGFSLATGDLNGDAVDDVVVGEPGFSPNTGMVYVFFNPLTGNFNTSQADVVLNGSFPGAWFGQSVAVGDVNGDTNLDIIVGAPEVSSGIGNVFIFFGPFSSNTTFYANSASAVLVGENSGDNAGWSVAAGDVNSDSFDDVLIGAPYFDTTLGNGSVINDTGKVYLVHGNNNNFTAPSPYPPVPYPLIVSNFSWLGEAFNDTLGWHVAIGDINNDTIGDVAMGAPGNDYGATNAGQAYIQYGSISGNANATLVNNTTGSIYSNTKDGYFGKYIRIGSFLISLSGVFGWEPSIVLPIIFLLGEPPLPPGPVCGNGILEPPELCDDGNLVSGDGCSATCVPEFCGDGTVQPGLGETCDPPGAPAAACGGAICAAGCGCPPAPPVPPGGRSTGSGGSTNRGDPLQANCTAEWVDQWTRLFRIIGWNIDKNSIVYKMVMTGPGLFIPGLLSASQYAHIDAAEIYRGYATDQTFHSENVYNHYKVIAANEWQKNTQAVCDLKADPICRSTCTPANPGLDCSIEVNDLPKDISEIIFVITDITGKSEESIVATSPNDLDLKSASYMFNSNKFMNQLDVSNPFTWTVLTPATGEVICEGDTPKPVGCILCKLFEPPVFSLFEPLALPERDAPAFGKPWSICPVTEEPAIPIELPVVERPASLPDFSPAVPAPGYPPGKYTNARDRLANVMNKFQEADIQTDELPDCVACAARAKLKFSNVDKKLNLPRATARVVQDLPAGYEVLKGTPFQIDNCGGDDISLTVNLPDTCDPASIRAYRCVGESCRAVEDTKIQDKLTCDGVSVKDVLDKMDKRDEIVVPDEFEEITARKKQITPGDRVISSGSYKLEFVSDADVVVRISKPTNAVRLPANPSLSFMSTPMEVLFDKPVPKASSVKITIPYKMYPNFDENSLGIYVRVEGSWIPLASKVDKQGKVVSAVVQDLDSLVRDNAVLFAVMGIRCYACITSMFEKVYDSGTRDALILVHGFSSDPTTWLPLIASYKLTKQPWQIWTFGYSSTEMPLDASAKDLADALQANNQDYDNIYIVGHSLGGLLAQKALETAEKNKGLYTFVKKIREVVLVGQPGAGTPAIEELYTKLYAFISKERDPFAKAFSLHPDVKDALTNGRQFDLSPELKSKISVLAGTQSYEFSVGYFTVTTEELLRFAAPNDGLVTTQSAKAVAGSVVNNSCDNYYEIKLTHTDLIDDEIAGQVMAYAVAKNKPEGDVAYYGHNQYAVLDVDNCQDGESFVVMCEKIPKQLAAIPLDCNCGNGVCGVGENSVNCPGDCFEITTVSGACMAAPISISSILIVFAILAILFLVRKRVYKIQQGSLFKTLMFFLALLAFAMIILQTAMCLVFPLFTFAALVVVLAVFLVDAIIPFKPGEVKKKK